MVSHGLNFEDVYIQRLLPGKKDGFYNEKFAICSETSGPPPRFSPGATMSVEAQRFPCAACSPP